MITIVLGMHRSGTSVVSGILHFNKVIMGTYETFWPRPLPQNPKGFYENYEFRKINDQLLRDVGYDTKQYKSKIPVPEMSEKIKIKMIKMIQKYESNFNKWGWKDPRTCLTISDWAAAIEEIGLIDKVKIIFVSRKSISVARSLKKRNQLPLPKGLSLWKTYTERSIDFCKNNKIPTLYLSFEGILENPKTHCEKLFQFLSHPFDQSIIDKFVDKNISTSSSGEEIALPDDILILEKKIESLLSS